MGDDRRQDRRQDHRPDQRQEPLYSRHPHKGEGLNLLSGVDNPAHYSPALKKAIEQAASVQGRLNAAKKSVQEATKGFPKHLCKVPQLAEGKRSKSKVHNASISKLKEVYGKSDCLDCRMTLHKKILSNKASAATYRAVPLEKYPPMSQVLNETLDVLPLPSLCVLASWGDLATYFSQPTKQSPEPLMYSVVHRLTHSPSPTRRSYEQ